MKLGHRVTGYRVSNLGRVNARNHDLVFDPDSFCEHFQRSVRFTIIIITMVIKMLPAKQYHTV